MDLCCPCPDDLWDAPDETAWGEQLLSWNPEDAVSLSLTSAVDAAMTKCMNERRLQGPIPMFCRHVLLCAIMEEAGLVKISRTERATSEHSS